jgi:hypothetical protein
MSNNTNNTSLKPNGQFYQQPQQQPSSIIVSPAYNFNTSLAFFQQQQQQQNVISPPFQLSSTPQYHHLQQYNLQQQPQQQVRNINYNSYPSYNHYATITSLFPHDNNNLFDLKNQNFINIPKQQSQQQQLQQDDGIKRSSSLNNLTNRFDIKPPIKPAPKLPTELQHPSYPAPQFESDNLIDFESTTNDDISMFDPLFEPVQVVFRKNRSNSIITKPTTTPNDNSLTIVPPLPPRKSITKIETPSETVKSTIKRNFSFYEKIDIIDEFIIIDKSLNEIVSEIETFEIFINELKDEINTKVDDKSTSASLTNSVIVYSPLLEQPILNDMDIKLIIRYFDSLNKIKQMSLNASINCTVEHFLYEILIRLEVQDLSTNKYLLKIHGKEEYLPLKEILGELKYIQECLCLNKDPIFMLIEVKNINKQLSFNGNDQKRFCYKLDEKICVNFVSKNKLDVLLKNISRNRTEIKQAVVDGDQNSLQNWCRNYKQNLKQLIRLVYNINYTSLIDLVERFEALELDLKSYHSKFELSELSKKLLNLVNDSMHACIKFCNCASKSFNWSFELDQGCVLDKTVAVEKKEIIQSNEKITLYVESLNNLAAFMSNLNVQLK